jgi:hypothetical protein
VVGRVRRPLHASGRFRGSLLERVRLIGGTGKPERHRRVSGGCERKETSPRPRRNSASRNPGRAHSHVEELGIGFVPFSPLGAGFLTGKIDANTKFEAGRFSRPGSALHSRGHQGQLRAGRSREACRGARGRHSGAGRARRVLAQKPWIVPIPARRSCATCNPTWVRRGFPSPPARCKELGASAAAIKIEGDRLPQRALDMTESRRRQNGSA